VRRLTGDSDALAWELVAQGTPNFTFSETLRQDAAVIRADLRRLTAERAPVHDLEVEFSGFVSELTLEQSQIEAKQLSQANLEVLDGVDGTAQVLRANVESLRAVYAARAASANARMYWGTLGALGASAILVALLATAFTTGRRRALLAERAALEQSERRFRALLHQASDAVLVTNRDGRITYATGAVQDVFAQPPEALIGRPLEDLVPPNERARTRQLLDRAISSGPGRAPTGWSLPRPGGAYGYFEAQSADFLDDPEVAGLVLTVRDVTGRHEMEAQLRHQALHDPLTGLPNRTLFEDRVGQALARLHRNGLSVGVIYVDVDDFKAVNDSLGHTAGDQLLRTIAGRIDAVLRGSDTAARLGGDEFACLLDALSDVDEAVSVARRLVAALAPPILLEGRTISIRASLGVAHCSGVTLTAEELIRNADVAMYAAKAETRGPIALFDDGMLTDARRRLDLREDLARAIDRGELALAYQPLVDLAERGVVGIEALLRWHHAEHGLIPPDQFIPVAESTGAIVDLGRWVLDRALADLHRWSARTPKLRINVNVAPRELLEPDYVDAVAAALGRHQISPERLTLELTESELEDDGHTSARLEALSQLGVRLAIDDFGSGQSSLARLQQLPVTQIKVDRSFLSTIDESSQHATLVRSMIELGHALGLQMVAEGIEREGQLEVLRTLPCQLGQGFLFGRPQDAEAIERLLAEEVTTSPTKLAASAD
jgi:diguanylate cyclase (GGDEF)-like protein/PAS domain S-box-containing protein